MIKEYCIEPSIILYSLLRQVRLREHGKLEIYKDADISVVEVLPDDLAPTQSYVLKSRLEDVVNLNEAFLNKGINIFRLYGFLRFKLKDGDGSWISILPPIVELEYSPTGKVTKILNDGMHRVYTARKFGLPVRVVVIDNVPKAFPYYAHPLVNGWDDVKEIDTLDATIVRKKYREPENHKALFRDFNAVFEGVQKERLNVK